MEKDIKKFEKWISTEAIAETVFGSLKESGNEATLENAKKVWLGVLDQLHNEVYAIAKYTHRLK